MLHIGNIGLLNCYKIEGISYYVDQAIYASNLSTYVIPRDTVTKRPAQKISAGQCILITGTVLILFMVDLLTLTLMIKHHHLAFVTLESHNSFLKLSIPPK